MAVTQTDIDALTARLAQLNQMLVDGVRSVTIGDQNIVYNTTDSLMRARDDVKDQLAAAQAQFAGRRTPRQWLLAGGDRGYHG